MSGLREVRLETPITDEDVAGLRQGDIVYLDGTIYTAREGAYKRVVEEGVALPVDLAGFSNVNFHCSPAASVGADGGYSVGAVTATASFRFAKWIEGWFDAVSTRMIIGKSGMTEQIYRDVFVPRGAVYLTTVGYGTGALLGRGIREVVDTVWLDELGIAQAIWIFRVKDFGPFIVDSDQQGTSLFAKSNREIESRIEALYDGLAPPILSRYGEKTGRDDEVI